MESFATAHNLGFLSELLGLENKGVYDYQISAHAVEKLNHVKNKAAGPVCSFVFYICSTLRKYKFLDGCRFDVARNFRNKVKDNYASALAQKQALQSASFKLYEVAGNDGIGGMQKTRTSPVLEESRSSTTVEQKMDILGYFR
jgi:hypothetical protein